MSEEKLNEIAKYSNQYVAISNKNEIIAADVSIKNLERKLKRMEVKDLTIRYITPIDKFISPVCQ